MKAGTYRVIRLGWFGETEEYRGSHAACERVATLMEAHDHDVEVRFVSADAPTDDPVIGRLVAICTEAL